jgi:hypothetical protein
MGRPPLGKAGRTITASTKLTASEAEWLVARDGTVHRGLRRAFDLLYATNGGTVPAPITDPALPGPVPVGTVHTQETLTGRCRIHDYGDPRVFMDKGQMFAEKTCKTCGYSTTGVAHQR